MSRRALLLFLGLGFAWGIPYLLIKVAVEEISPSQLVLARCALAALLLLPVAIMRGAVVPVLRRWRPLLAYSIIEIAIPWVALGSAEQHLPSSTTGLLIAAVPLAGLATAYLTGRAERLNPTAWLGLALGIAGVGALVGLDVGGSDLGAVGLLGITVIGYAVGPAILARSLGDLPGLGVVALSLSITTVLYVPIVLVTDGVPSGVPNGDVIVSVLILALALHGGGVPLAVRSGRRGRSGPRDHDHLRQPCRRGRRRSRRPRRGADGVDRGRLRSRGRRVLPGQPSAAAGDGGGVAGQSRVDRGRWVLGISG